jgi:hypothetical protein
VRLESVTRERQTPKICKNYRVFDQSRLALPGFETQRV